MEDINDLTKIKQPIGRLDKLDIKKSFRIIKAVYYGTQDVYQMATVIREWKKIIPA